MNVVETPVPSGDTIFCDDIRHEVNGKTSLIGVYNGLLIVDEMPVFLPRICCFITLRQAADVSGDVVFKVIWQPDEGEEKFIAETIVPKEGRKTLMAVGPQKEESAPLIGVMRTFFEISPFQLVSNGRLKVRSFIDNVEIKLGSLRMVVGDVTGHSENTP